MSALGLENLFHVGVDILKTEVSGETSSIMCQTGDAFSGDPGSETVWMQHVGFASRPSKVSPDGNNLSCAQGVILKQSDYDVCIGTRDTRTQTIFASIKEGETAVFAAGGDGLSQAKILLKDDGSINLYTTDTNTTAGKSVYLRLATDGLQFTAPWGTLTFDESGFHVLHSSGASFDLGGIYGVPGFDSAPLNTLTSYVTMQAGTISSQSSAQAFGVGAPLPLAGSVGTLSAISALQAQITSLQTVIAAIVGAPTGPIGTAALAPQLPALAASAASVASSILTIPASTSST